MNTRVPPSEVQGWWFEQVFRGSTANRAECLWRAKHIHLDEGGVSTSVRTCWFFARILFQKNTVGETLGQMLASWKMDVFLILLRVLFIQLGWKMI